MKSDFGIKINLKVKIKLLAVENTI